MGEVPTLVRLRNVRFCRGGATLWHRQTWPAWTCSQISPFNTALELFADSLIGHPSPSALSGSSGGWVCPLTADIAEEHDGLLSEALWSPFPFHPSIYDVVDALHSAAA